MNTPSHDWHHLVHFGLRGHAAHARSLRIERLLQRWGWLIPSVLLILGLFASWPAHAEPGNAPDTKGHFVLVVGGSAKTPIGYGYGISLQNFTRIQPFIIVGFQSFKLCVGAGKELQARLNTDGYTLDFACVATGR